MPSPTLAIASSSDLATQAGGVIAKSGGNAVDAAVAAGLVTLITEPGVVALGGGGYITLQTPNEDPVTLDGYMAVPGLGNGRVCAPDSMRSVTMEYGGGVTTLVGHASVCTPGALKALERAVGDYGNLNWSDVVQPAVDIAKNGFPLSQACHNYLVYSHDSVFGVCPASAKALHDNNGRLLNVGDTVFVENLADSLELIASQGSSAFYTGAIANLIIDDMRVNNGSLDAKDLSDYQVILRPALTFDRMGWTIATNPPPAVGGATLAALLLAIEPEGHQGWDSVMVKQMLQAQEYVLGFRREHLDRASDIKTAIDQLLANAANMGKPGSPSTVHTSAVDNNGYACAITMSAGYGSGVIAKETGIWLNNTLGELELNRKAANSLQSGERMMSNMAPTVATHENGTILSIGSPGADRITTALAHTLVGYLGLGLDLTTAVHQPRLHLEWYQDKPRFAYEPGLEVTTNSHPTRPTRELSMYFGGVGAVSYDRETGFVASKDPRRAGSAIVVAT
ncbi:MAG: gamma-glutamyltransferase [Pseudomonadota bacterium]